MKSTLEPTKESRPSIASEKELVVRAQTGDGSAFEELVRRHGPRVYRLARYLCSGHAEDAEDTFQNALLKAYRRLATFRGEAQFSTWLTRIAVNECLLHWRGQRRERNWVHLDEPVEQEHITLPLEINTAVDGPEEDPEKEYARLEFRAVVEQCLTCLPDSSRVAFLLRHMEGLSTQEIAERLGQSAPATKSQVRRARLRLQRCLSKKFCRDEKCYWPVADAEFGSPTTQKEKE